jgi:5-methylcytosine-specific restriction endonuclease McrA
MEASKSRHMDTINRCICGSLQFKSIAGPWAGGHHAKVVCATCGRFQKWESKPRELKTVDPRSEVSKKLVAEFSQGFCEMCLRRKSELPLPQTLEGHHVVPVALNGSDDRSNIWILCTSCHRRIHHERTYLGHYHTPHQEAAS